MLTVQSEIALAHPLSKAPVAEHLPELSGVNTIDQFAALAIGWVDLSRAASRIAVEEASRGDVRKFAAHELMKAETIVALLEDLGTPVPQMGGERWAALAQIINAPAGRAFDTVYMATSYENHAYLRDVTAAFLRNSHASDSREHYGRQLAQAALSAFTEHTGDAHRVLRELAI
jgi:hypothetical protein